MHQTLFLVALLLLSCSTFATNLRFGQISEFELVDSVNLEWKEADYGATPTLEDGEKFAIVKIILKAGRSLGKYDYTLSDAKCLAIAADGQAFNPERWVTIADKSAIDLSLLYKVKEAEAPFTFFFNYDVSSVTPDERHVILGMVEETIEEPEPEPAVAEPAEDAGGAEPVVEPVAVEEPAAAAEPEVKKDEPPAKVEPKPAAKPEDKKPVVPAKPAPKPTEESVDW